MEHPILVGARVHKDERVGAASVHCSCVRLVYGVISSDIPSLDEFALVRGDQGQVSLGHMHSSILIQMFEALLPWVVIVGVVTGHKLEHAGLGVHQGLVVLKHLHVQRFPELMVIGNSPEALTDLRSVAQIQFLQE